MRKTKIVLVGIGLLALAGGGTALAGLGKGRSHTATATGTTTARMHHGPHGRGGQLDAAATYLGVSEDSLLTQLRSGKTLAQIANATSGKSASGLIDALVADAKQHFGSNVPSDLTQRITDFVNGVRPSGPPPFGGPRGPHGPAGFGLGAAATYLGISESSVFTQLRSGKTLAQIADATSGKSAAGLIAALVADAKKQFGSNVPSDLTQRITDLVNGVHPSRPDGPGRGFFHRIGTNA
jgi:hypothetical protein